MKKFVVICCILAAFSLMAFAAGKEVVKSNNFTATAPVVVKTAPVQASTANPVDEAAAKLEAERLYKEAVAAENDAMGRANNSLDDCTTPFPEDYSSAVVPALPACWTMIDADADGSKIWKSSATGGHLEAKCAYISWRAPSINDWLISPSVSLSAGVNYTLKFWQKAAGSYTEKLDIWYGTSATVAAMTNSIAASYTFNGTTYVQKVFAFTPTIDGTYYIGWHGSSLDALGIYLDEFELAQTPTAPGRCCYGGSTCVPPTCEMKLESECAALGGTFNASLDCHTPCSFTAPQPGEACCNALPITVPTSIIGTTVGFMNDYPYNGNTAPDVVYSYTPTVNQSVTFSLCYPTGTSFDTYLYIYDTICTGTPMRFDDDSCDAPNGAASKITCAPLTAGHTYFIVVDGYSANSGAYELTATECASTGRCVYGNPCAPSCSVTDLPSCTALSGVWTMGADCSVPPTAPQAGDLFCNAIPLTVPGCVDGNNSTFVDNYNAVCPYTSSGKDVVYSFTAPETQLLTFSTCQGHTNYDTKIYVVAADMATVLGCNDDACQAPLFTSGAYNSLIECLQVTQGVKYYVIVDAYSAGDFGDYTLCVSVCNPCILACPENAVMENEPTCADEYVDNFNGGCNATVPTFSPIACGETICGTSGTFTHTEGTTVYNSRDTDWYELVLTTHNLVTFTGTAEFPVTAGFVAAPCPATTFLASASALACAPLTVTYDMLPGTYYLVVLPTAFTGVTCGAKYFGTLSCVEECPVVDYLANPIEIVEHSYHYSTTVNTCCATNSLPNVCTASTGGDVIFKVCVDPTITVSASGPCDNQITVFTDLNDPAGSEIGCADAGVAGDPEVIEGLVVANWSCWYIGVSCWNGCGEITLTIDSDQMLPVELTNYTATAGDNSVSLNWSTASETNNASFDIVRNGSTIGSVTSAGTAHNYTWVDNRANNGTTYEYTLVSVNANGDRRTLQTVSATPNMNAANVNEYALHNNFPNPFNPTTDIVFDMKAAGNVSLKVYNLLGQSVATLVNGSVEAGRHTVRFDATNLPSGLYIYKMEANGFSAQSKMMLMK